MVRTGKKLSLFLMVLMCLLMVIGGINGYLTPIAYSLDPSIPEKSLAIFNDVIGLDMVAYSANLEQHSQNPYLFFLPRESVVYVLESGESRLKLICDFVNGNLQSMLAYVKYGSPQMVQPTTDMLEMAKGFISRYQNYSGISYYEPLKSMLDAVEANENVTITSGDAKLKVTYSGNSASFRWIYTLNGVEAESKCIALHFERGFLKYFTDKWSIYKIGSTDINLSKEEAINLAMDTAENYSWKVTFGNEVIEVTEFNISGVSEATLMFTNEIWQKDARGGDPLTVYPRWRIRLYFDKLYPGKVYGVNVGIWADTKEVIQIRTMILMGDSSYNPPAKNEDPVDNENPIVPPSNEEISDGRIDPNLTSFTWIALPIVISLALGVATIHYRRKRTHSPRSLTQCQNQTLQNL